MSKLWISSVIIFVSHIEVVKDVFVSIGNYPAYKPYGLNSDDCGLRYAPRNTIPIYYSFKCFQHQYENRIFLDYSKPLRRTAYNSPMKRIFKGKDVEIGESPWTLSLSIVKSDQKRKSCTAILITFEWVMTAAHCFPRGPNGIRDYDKVYVFAGSNKKGEGEKIEANINKLLINPNYTFDIYYDIAVIKLFDKFDKTKLNGITYLINTICLPQKEQINYNKENVTFFGYGMTNITNYAERYLQKADVILEPFPDEYSLYISSMGYKSSSCPGDSGGPMVQYLDNRRNRAVLVAVTKGTMDNNSCSLNNDFGVFTPVSKNIDWILKSILYN